MDPMTDQHQEQEIAFAREKAKRTLPVALLVLLGLVAMYLPLPKRFVAVLPLVLAIVLTVRLLRFLSMRGGKEKIWPVVTLVISGMLLSSLALQVVFYDSVRAYEECLAGAQTSIAEGSCAPLKDAGMVGLVIR
jgi:heme/copper-type cytochrome/quinol oxidase subunit 4